MQIENLCGALAYISLIDDLENYREKIKNLELPEGFLKLKIKDNLYIFNDSYNANPKGVFDSLKFFQSLDFDYKIVIFNGILELGRETKEIYQELAKEFLAFDKIIVTSTDFQNIFKEILKDKFLPIDRKQELELFLQSLKQPKVGILIFNRFPEKVKINL
jgi:UDP-N-acetylmuramyl pentapeptide synthase